MEKESDLDNIVDVRICDKGIIAIAPDEGKDDETKIYLINKEGKKEWKTDVKGIVQILEPTEKGIVFFTSERANLLTYEKGDEVLEKRYPPQRTAFLCF